MQKKEATLREQISHYRLTKQVLASDGTTDWCHGFYDWFCKDSSLERKAKSLMAKVIKFTEAHPEIDINDTYVFFKNNCPMVGPLYDDFRICDRKEGNVIFTVTPKCGHSGKAEVWGRANEFKGPIQVADKFSDLLAA
jgi:hypothetical protein